MKLKAFAILCALAAPVTMSIGTASAAEVAPAMSGVWKLYYSWGCTTGYGSADLTFTVTSGTCNTLPGCVGTFSGGGSSGTFAQVMGNIVWKFTNGTAYSGTVTGYSSSGMMSAGTFTSNGCWYMVANGGNPFVSGSEALDASGERR